MGFSLKIYFYGEVCLCREPHRMKMEERPLGRCHLMIRRLLTSHTQPPVQAVNEEPPLAHSRGFPG